MQNFRERNPNEKTLKRGEKIISIENKQKVNFAKNCFISMGKRGPFHNCRRERAS